MAVKATAVGCVYVRIAGGTVSGGVPGMGPLPGPAPDYSELWERFAAWMRSEGVEPLWLPPQQWGIASFGGGFAPADAARVVAWLRLQGVEVKGEVPT